MKHWERASRITTPESVALEMRMAGPGTRFLALLIDLVVVLVLMSMVEYVIMLIVATVAGSGAGANELVGVFAVLFITATTFTIFFGYWFALETWWGGQTVGKKALGIRAVMKGGYPLTPSASLIRNLVRIVDMIPPPLFFVGLTCMALSKNYQRLGDLAAGTLVVRDRLYRAPASGFFFAGLQPEQVAFWDTSAVTSADLELIRRFLARRTTLRPGARYSTGFRLAKRFRTSVTGAGLGPDLPPEVFLEGIVLERQVRSTRLPRAG